MLKCNFCEGFFRDSYNLKRHLARIKSCNPDKPKELVAQVPTNSALGKQDSALGKQDSALGKQDSALGKQDSASGKQNNCDYCVYTFYNNQSKKRHEKICKHRNETRFLEIEMGIDPVIPKSKTECRFCNKTMFRTDALSKHMQVCKERLEYHEQLLKEKNEKQKKEKIQDFIQTQNNTTNNYNTVNNLIIQFNENTVPFGNKRLTDHIKIERIVEILRASYAQYQPNQEYEIAGEMILRIEEYLQEIPENRNYLTDQKSQIWTVKTESGIKYLEKEKCLNSIVKENASILCEQQDRINEVNQKVFKNKSMTNAFYHQNEFKSKGIHYKPEGEKKMSRIKAGLQTVTRNVADF